MSPNKLFEYGHSSIQFCSLGSGSKGNATVVAFKHTILLIDCGFSTRETIRRLSVVGISPKQITAILVTHEHADHISGVARFSNKFSIPVWLNKGTSFHKKCSAIKLKNIFNSHLSFKLGDFNITPVPVPHDSREAAQFILSIENQKLGLLTDVGQITQHIINAYAKCNVLLLEFNYDHQMLINGSYPYALKQRVSSGLGHLSNDQAINFLKKIDSSQLQLLVVMHKSEENNHVSIIEDKLETISWLGSDNYFIAEQTNGFSWLKIT